MGRFLHDTFTDADGTLLQNHTGEIGASWTKYPGYANDAVITSNRLRGNGAADSEFYYASGLPPAADYDVEVTFKVVTLLAGDSPTFMARADTGVAPGNDTYYYVQYQHDTGNWVLGKAVAGTFSELGTFSQSYSAGDAPVAQLELRGSTLRLFLDGTLRISASDAALGAPGRVGVSLYNSDGTAGYHIEAITATDHSMVRPRRLPPQPAVSGPRFEYDW
jgi:hypothetical protein